MVSSATNSPGERLQRILDIRAKNLRSECDCGANALRCQPRMPRQDLFNALSRSQFLEHQFHGDGGSRQ
jgi:hypothetical protein